MSQSILEYPMPTEIHLLQREPVLNWASITEGPPEVRSFSMHEFNVEALWGVIWDQHDVGLALVSPEGEFMEVNGGLARMTGYSVAELQGKRWQDISHPEDIDPDRAMVKQSSSSLTPYDMTKRYITKRNEVIWIQLHAAPVTDSQGNFLHFLSIITYLGKDTPLPAAPSRNGKNGRRSLDPKALVATLSVLVGGAVAMTGVFLDNAAALTSGVTIATIAGTILGASALVEKRK